MWLVTSAARTYHTVAEFESIVKVRGSWGAQRVAGRWPGGKRRRETVDKDANSYIIIIAPKSDIDVATIRSIGATL